MDNYIVSARKYRPSTFRSVVGQKALTQTLKNAIDSNKLAHAYLFCGPRGVGKTSCARIFAKTINCFHPTESGEACNECESCRAFNEQRSYNIIELDARLEQLGGRYTHCHRPSEDTASNRQIQSIYHRRGAHAVGCRFQRFLENAGRTAAPCYFHSGNYREA